MGFLQRLGLAPIPGAVALDEMTLETVAELGGVGGHDGALAAHDGSVWITASRGKELVRIDAATRVEAARVKLPRRPVALTADERGAVALCEKDVIVRVDPAGERVVAEAEVPEGAADVVASQGHVWAHSTSLSGMSFAVSLLQLDPASLRVMREVPLPESRYSGGLRAQDGIVSVLVEDPPGEMRDAVLDVATGDPLPDERRIKTRGIAERDGNRWLKEGEREFKRVDIATDREVARGEAPGPRTGSSVMAGGCLWVLNYRPPAKPDNEDTD